MVLISLLALPAPALGQGPGEISPDPAVNQYVESVPTAEGPRPSSGSRDDGGAGLSPQARRRLRAEGGADADDLAAIATAPQAGAPERSDGKRRARGQDASAKEQEPAPSPAPIAATVDAATAEGGGKLPLLIGLLAITGVIGGVALARRRSPA